MNENKGKILYIILILIILLSVIYLYKIKSANPAAKVPDSQNSDIVYSQNTLKPQEGLPAHIEAKRQAIYKAAEARDYELLTDEASPNIMYSFGGEYEGGFEAYLKLTEQTEGRNAFDVIPRLLEIPYSHENGVYVWPYMFSKSPSEWTEEDIRIMKTFLSDEMIQSFRDFGGYMDYRLGINEEGEWIFYVAGD